jgi:hypothetical protein
VDRKRNNAPLCLKTEVTAMDEVIDAIVGAPVWDAPAVYAKYKASLSTLFFARYTFF